MERSAPPPPSTCMTPAGVICARRPRGRMDLASHNHRVAADRSWHRLWVGRNTQSRSLSARHLTPVLLSFGWVSKRLLNYPPRIFTHQDPPASPRGSTFAQHPAQHGPDPVLVFGRLVGVRSLEERSGAPDGSAVLGTGARSPPCIRKLRARRPGFRIAPLPRFRSPNLGGLPSASLPAPPAAFGPPRNRSTVPQTRVSRGPPSRTGWLQPCRNRATSARE